MSRYLVLSVFALSFCARSFGQDLESVAEKLIAFQKQQNRVFADVSPQLGDAAKALRQIIESVKEKEQPPSQSVIALLSAIVDGLLEKPSLDVLGLKEKLAAHLADATPSSAMSRADLHEWLVVAAHLSRTQAASLVVLAERQRNEQGLTDLDLVFQSIDLQLDIRLSLTRSTFAKLPIDDDKRVALVRDTLLAHLELEIQKRARKNALEAWELEHRRAQGGIRRHDQECRARERVFFYEAKVQEAKAALIRLGITKSDEVSRNLIPFTEKERKP